MAKTAAEKAADKKKKDAEKAAALGSTGKTVIFTLTEAFLAAHPEYVAQGFEVGQEVEVPKELVDSLDDHEEVADTGRTKEDEASMSAEPTGKFIVRPVASGGFRLYNERGQAVSPICIGQEEVVKINKAMSRSNAINDAQKVTTPKKPTPAPTVQ